jgi:hypothetical protein
VTDKIEYRVVEDGPKRQLMVVNNLTHADARYLGLFLERLKTGYNPLRGHPRFALTAVKVREWDDQTEALDQARDRERAARKELERAEEATREAQEVVRCAARERYEQLMLRKHERERAAEAAAERAAERAAEAAAEAAAKQEARKWYCRWRAKRGSNV